MGFRRQSREIALQVLFQIETSHQGPDEALNLFFKEHPHQDEIEKFSCELVLGCFRNQKEIDQLIESSSKNWKMSRMSLVDRSLLRMISFEILYCEDIPLSVSINEAVEIAKKFGTEESPSFVNGILDRIGKEKNK